jgi:hypothetical protein
MVLQPNALDTTEPEYAHPSPAVVVAEERRA